MSTSTTYNARTYSRRSSAKRKQSLDADSEPRKKQKPSEELTDVEDRSPSPSPSPLRTYGTPKRGLAKDLSSIFQSYTPLSSPHATPTKLASRMLGRSKTDSSIDSTSTDRTPLLADRTSSLPVFSSPKPSGSGSSIQDVRPPPVPLTTNTRTYAGKSRSFLVAVPASSLADEDEDEYTARESYASLRSRWGVDNSEDDPYPSIVSPTRSDSTSTPSGTPSRSGRGKAKAQQAAPLPNGMMNPLKSITELRNKGESRRFLDEVGYLFEGMHSTVGIGLRRASALEITTKLCDADFSRKAKAADFLSRAWDVFGEAGAGRGEDKILDTLLAFFAALVSRDPASLRDLAQRPPVVPPPHVAAELSKPRSNQTQTLSVSRPSSLVDTLFSLLTAPSDPLSLIFTSSLKDKVKVEGELKRTGIGKKERGTFQTIHDTIVSKSSLFPANTPISTPLLILHALKTLPPSLIPQKHFPTLLASLRHTLAPLLPSSSSSTPLASNFASLSWPDAAPVLPYESAFCHLRMLDVYLLGQWGTSVHTATPGDADPFVDIDESERRVEAERERRANEAAMGPWLADALVAVAVCAELSTAASSWGSGSGAGSDSARKCMETALRVLVSLTHANAVWARRIAESECALAFVLRVVVGDSGGGRAGVEVKKEEDAGELGKSKKKGSNIKLEEEFGDESPGADDTHGSDDDHRMQSIDMLCLALGLLTNLIQGVPGFKDVLRDARLNPACTLKKRACVRRCTCAPAKSISALDVLIRVYNHYQPHPHLSSSINTTTTITTDTRRPKAKQDHDLPPPPLSPPHRDLELGDALFLRGHLAVVFGLLIRGSPENEAYILRALAGSTSGDEAEAEVAVVRGLAEQAREFVAFYVALGGGAGEGAGDGAEDMRVARGVVMFLEGLRA